MKNLTDEIVPPYHVQSTAVEVKNGFPYFAHHDSVSSLWAQKWRQPCQHGIYPFSDGNVADFDPIFEELIKMSGDSSEILSRPDDYASVFIPTAEQLVRWAEEAEEEGDVPKARDLYLRGAAVYRIARFPINRSRLTQLAWERGKSAYLKGGRYLSPPNIAINILFGHADVSAGDQNVPIQAYLRIPNGESPASGWPILLFICGLDAYKTDNTSRMQLHADHGFATLSFEIPGTGDCPAAPNDPTSPDRLMSSVLDWVYSHASKYGFNTARIVARGISTGGYYAIRVAHTHAQHFYAVAAQGGSCHHMFDPAWIRAQNQMEYPFALADAMAYKFGYREQDSVAAYALDARKFSLLDAGLLDQKSCRLLLINGMEDSIFPIEDNFIVACRGVNKDLLARGNRGHMGNPGGEDLLYTWLDEIIAEKP